MENRDKELDLIVLSYLKKRGYRQAENSFLKESNVQSLSIDQMASNANLDIESSVSNYITFYSAHEQNSPMRYDDSYTKLKEWIDTSLDLYRREFLAILYPVFVHCFLDLVSKNYLDEARNFLKKHRADHEDLHDAEISKFEAVSSPLHIQESEVAHMFRSNKYNVTLCGYSFEMLIAFLHESKFMLLLSIINQYLSIKVVNAKPGQLEEDTAAISGRTDYEMSLMNSREIFLGMYDEFDRMQRDREKAAAGDKPDEKEASTPEDKSEGKDDGGKKKDGKKSKKEREEKEQKLVKPKSSVPLPRVSEHLDTELREDLSKRVSLNAQHLPSVCFFTMFHTHKSLNAIEISPEGSQVAGAFADSTVRLWDLKKSANDNGNSKRKRLTDDYRLLLGHSGPVYGASFSPDRQFLLSCSEDNSARLWSLDTFTNVVAYKGHNYPVWDVSFSPLGFYFATASHDRTARLWGTSHIFPLRIFAGHLSDVNKVCWHPNVNYLATGSADKTVRLWEVHTGKCVRIFTHGGHSAGVNALAISPDGKTLASAGDDKSILLWDLATSQKIKRLTGHTKSIYSLDFSMEGSLLASGGHDGTVRIWDTNSERTTSLSTESNGGVSTSSASSSSASNLSSSSSTSSSTTVTSTPAVAPSSSMDAGSSPTQIGENLSTFHTKHTPVFHVKFTRRNLLLASGPFIPPIPPPPETIAPK